MVIGHAILCVSSGIALSAYSSHALSWQFGTFALLFGHGVIGVIDCCSETPDGHCFHISLSIVDVVPLPFINTELFLASSMGSDIALLHGASGIIAVICNFCCNNSFSESLKDIVVVGNVISLAILSVKQDRPMYGLLAAIGAINRFVIGKSGQTSQGLSIGLSAFSLCAAHVLSNSDMK